MLLGARSREQIEWETSSERRLATAVIASDSVGTEWLQQITHPPCYNFAQLEVIKQNLFNLWEKYPNPPPQFLSTFNDDSPTLFFALGGRLCFDEHCEGHV